VPINRLQQQRLTCSGNLVAAYGLRDLSGEMNLVHGKDEVVVHVESERYKSYPSFTNTVSSDHWCRESEAFCTETQTELVRSVGMFDLNA